MVPLWEMYIMYFAQIHLPSRTLSYIMHLYCLRNPSLPKYLHKVLIASSTHSSWIN